MTLAAQITLHRNPNRCRCHSDDIYLTLSRCPKCRHWSLDSDGEWAACERRRCGYEVVKPSQPGFWS